MLLELQNLGKSFGEHEVLKDVNAGVERGDRIGIIGANGTGKTTLLRILCGESLPDAGDAAFGTGVTCRLSGAERPPGPHAGHLRHDETGLRPGSGRHAEDGRPAAPPGCGPA